MPATPSASGTRRRGDWAWLSRYEGTASLLGGVADHASSGPKSPAAGNEPHHLSDAMPIRSSCVSARDWIGGFSRPGTSYQVCPQGGLVAIFSGDPPDQAAIWSLERNQAVIEFAGSRVAFDPSGRRSAPGEGGRHDLGAGHGNERYEFASAVADVVGGDVVGATWRSARTAGGRLRSTGGRSLVIRDATTGNEILELPESAGTPDFSPDGLKLASVVGQHLTLRFADPSDSRPAGEEACGDRAQACVRRAQRRLLHDRGGHRSPDRGPRAQATGRTGDLRPARTESSYSNGSGDYAIAFTTSAELRSRSGETRPTPARIHPTEAVSPLFQAVLEATEEAV